MFSFIEDIRFFEELKAKGFSRAYTITLVDDPAFGNLDGKNRHSSGIYSYFRTDCPIEGTIVKPTGTSGRTITLDGTYHVEWRETGDSRWFYLISI